MPSDIKLDEVLRTISACNDLYDVSRWLTVRQGPRSPHVRRLHLGSPLEIVLLVSGSLAGTLFVISKAVRHIVESAKASAEIYKLEAETAYIESQDQQLRNDIALRRTYLGSAEGRKIVRDELAFALAKSDAPVGLRKDAVRVLDEETRPRDEPMEPRPIARNAAELNVRALIEAANLLGIYGVRVDVEQE
ncbi:MAG: hypothetical protein J0I43_16180 [Microbacterium sp.]|uniref:hypothetical protein n=1 Tax=Microbacterium sp. TaxID=51671 RepID=UPI001AD0DBF8|nr:hypothetical protein [Microbacterium sp.]MBN9178887.1 hypothetical protein [Microbacterium sp.]